MLDCVKEKVVCCNITSGSRCNRIARYARQEAAIPWQKYFDVFNKSCEFARCEAKTWVPSVHGFLFESSTIRSVDPRKQDRAEQSAEKWKTKVSPVQNGPRSAVRPTPSHLRTKSHAATAVTKSAIRARRRKKRRRRGGGPRVFRRGQYSWLKSCVEPKDWECPLKLLGGDRPVVSSLNAQSLTETTAPRPMMRRGDRHNPSEFNPLRVDLPREGDIIPGPKYDRPPGAFGRTGGSGGTVAPSASVSSLDRFPRGRLFEEEEMREREATPGPEAYDVLLYHRLEGAALEEMRSSLGLLSFWNEELHSDPDIGVASDWPFAGSDLANSDSFNTRLEKDTDDAPIDHLRRKSESRSLGRTMTTADEKAPPECSKGNRIYHEKVTHGRATGHDDEESLNKSGTSLAIPTPNKSCTLQGSGSRRQCRCLPRSASTAERRALPCRECLHAEVDVVAGGYLAAVSSLSESNSSCRARAIGASIRFGDMPRQRSAPSFSIGRGARDTTSRVLHTPGETVYKEARLGRSGPGPSTASPRMGDCLTKPRLPAASVVLPAVSEGRGSGTLAAAEKGVPVGQRETWSVDGALGVQVKSHRSTSPSVSLAGPRRTAHLFHERLRYGGKVGGNCSEG